MPEETLRERGSSVFDVVGRLAPGTTATAAASELTTLRRALHDGDTRWSVS